MKRWPLIPTLLVAAAVATMLALGVWQLQRKAEKEAQVALLAANSTKPPIAFPELGPVSDSALFRKSSALCLGVVGWRSGSGKDASGKPGIRYLADCRTGAEGPGLLVAAGIADRPNLTPSWTGGPVVGVIVTEPDTRNMIERAFGPKRVMRPMLVSGESLGGLRQAAAPDPRDIPNNHLLYAIQWFIFASAAAIIYGLALRKKLKAG